MATFRDEELAGSRINEITTPQRNEKVRSQLDGLMD